MANSPIDRERKLTIRLLILATILALLVVFIAENFVVVEVRIITRSVEMRLAWAMLIAVAIGVLLGLLLKKLWR